MTDRDEPKAGRAEAEAESEAGERADAPREGRKGLAARAGAVLRHPSTTAGVVFALCGAGAVAALVLGATASVVGGLLAVAVAALGVASVRFAKEATGESTDVEDREVKGPDLARRRLIAGGGVAAGAVAGGSALAVASWRSEAATEQLRRTAWARGVAVVTPEGRPVAVGELTVGDSLTIYPATAVGAADAQALLLRLRPGRVAAAGPGGAATGVPEGLVAYSRLCTHMACPLGLYQQRNEILLCPCHQAVFDVTRNGIPVRGPASRPLPRLPLAVVDGFLVADGPFTDAVGTGFWGRP
jgi:ubiquinol-cytochrome c reductase iron-sulfur subunit